MKTIRHVEVEKDRVSHTLLQHEDNLRYRIVVPSDMLVDLNVVPAKPDKRLGSLRSDD
jgi:hypothetical protein